MRSLYIYFFAFLLVGITANGQEAPLGAWKDYLSYRNGTTVTMGQSTVYCVAGSGLFSYNTADNSIEKLSKVTGLSDVGPTVARYSTANNVLVIGYPDGNIDILHNKTIVTIPDLKNSPVQGSKKINCVYFPPNTSYALIGCGQGIMQVDLTQDVILNTYYLGSSGSALNVYGITLYNDSIFAATQFGVYKAALNDPNLNNYNDWHLAVPYPVQPWGPYNSIVTIGDSVYASFSFYTLYSIPGKDTVFVYSNGNWSHYKFNGSGGNLLQGTIVYSLETSQVGAKNYLIASTQFILEAIDASNNNEVMHIGNYLFSSGGSSVSANDALLDASMNIWVADRTYGLVKASLPYFGATVYTPSGPYSNQAFSMAASNNDVWIVPGAYDANFSPEYISTGPSVLESGNWNYIQNSPVTYTDLNCIAIDPWKPLHAFAGSWGAGLVEFNNNKVVNIWNSSNTNNCIQNVFGTAPSSINARIGGVAYDTLGNVWVTSSLTTSKYLAVEKPNLSWQAFDFGGITNLTQAAQVTTVLITQSQAKWMLFYGTGIIAYQDNGTFAAPNNSNTQLITATTGNGGLPDLNISCMTVDLNGSIWVGTDERVVVFYSPDNVFDGNHDWDAQPVYVTQNGYTQYLMQNQLTTAIAVDGANQKWIGTQGGGVFLMSADGTQQIYNFTSSNSPLLSNNIQSIVINPANGEVFIATDKGVVSYKGSATEGLSSFGNVYAYPDPVPHDYTGPIAIKNLVTNADVKITTVNGKLVYHTIALGGQATWNGNNFDGKRVQTGVYLVFCSSPDGSQTKVTKLLFIN